jgi:hypothetical protein
MPGGRYWDRAKRHVSVQASALAQALDRVDGLGAPFREARHFASTSLSITEGGPALGLHVTDDEYHR